MNLERLCSYFLTRRFIYRLDEMSENLTYHNNIAKITPAGRKARFEVVAVTSLGEYERVVDRYEKMAKARGFEYTEVTFRSRGKKSFTRGEGDDAETVEEWKWCYHSIPTAELVAVDDDGTHHVRVPTGDFKAFFERNIQQLIEKYHFSYAGLEGKTDADGFTEIVHKNRARRRRRGELRADLRALDRDHHPRRYEKAEKKSALPDFSGMSRKERRAKMKELGLLRS